MNVDGMNVDLRRVAIWLLAVPVLAVMVLGACGGDDTTGTGPTATVTVTGEPGPTDSGPSGSGPSGSGPSDSGPTTDPSDPSDPVEPAEPERRTVEPERLTTVDESDDHPWPVDLAMVISGNDQRAPRRLVELAGVVRAAGDEPAATLVERADLDEVLVVAHGYDNCPGGDVTWWVDLVEGTRVLTPELEDLGIDCEVGVPVIDIETFSWSALDVAPGEEIDIGVSSDVTVTTARPIGELIGVIPDEAEPWATTPSIVAVDADGLAELGERVATYPEIAAEVAATDPATSFVVAVAYDECTQPSLRWTLDEAALTVTVIEPDTSIQCFRAQYGLAVYRFDRASLPGDVSIRQAAPHGELTVLAERLDP